MPKASQALLLKAINSRNNTVSPKGPIVKISVRYFLGSMHLYEGWVHPLLYPSRVYAQGFTLRIQACSRGHCLCQPSFMEYAHTIHKNSLMNQVLSQAQGYSLVRLRHLVLYMPRRGALLGLSLVVRSMVLMICNARASCYVIQVVLGFFASLRVFPYCSWFTLFYSSVMAPAWLRCKVKPPRMRGRQMDSFVRLFVCAWCTCSLTM